MTFMNGWKKINFKLKNILFNKFKEKNWIKK